MVRVHGKGWGLLLLASLVASAALAALPSPGTVRAQTITEFVLPSSAGGPQGITAGPDGAVWFAEGGTNKIGRITPGGAITEFPLPSDPGGPFGITAGPDGALWFTLAASSKIGRITTGGIVTLFPLPGVANPGSITAGPDGALWFTEGGTNGIGRITTGGAVTEFPLPGGAGSPLGITAGPDGALWFTETGASRIGRITTGGAIGEFPLPAGSGDAFGITAGPDGALWFTEFSGSRIGRMTTAGIVSEIVLAAGSGPQGITAGRDGALWFTESGSNRIGRATTLGAVTEYPLPAGDGVRPRALNSDQRITAGPDGAVWFTEGGANRIGRITTPPVAPTATVTATPTATPAPACNPRPAVGVSVVASGVGRFLVTLTAQTALGTPSNQVLSLSFGAGTNALIDVPGGPTGATGNFVVNLPSRPQQTTFVIRPATTGVAMTVPLIVTDSCGAWPTFVGAGPNAGPDAGPSATPSPSAGASAAQPVSTATVPPTLPAASAALPPAASVRAGPTGFRPCASRPDVGVLTTPSSDGRLQVVVSAQPAADAPQNRLRALRFGAATNARIDAPGHVGAAGGFALDLLPGAAQATFFVRQVAADGRFSVPIVAVDDCGEWSTTVVGGELGPRRNRPAASPAAWD